MKTFIAQLHSVSGTYAVGFKYGGTQYTLLDQEMVIDG